MPSATTRTEKSVNSIDVTDPVKLFSSMLEKRIRNLEKRKIKLDNYRSDVENGKELNEDQKIAVSKYGEVISCLEMSKELTKSVNGMALDYTRHLKKQAKKELVERQQQEVQRLQEAFIYSHILSCFQNQDVRTDFLNGENGAIQLSSEQLSELDQLFKLISRVPAEQADMPSHFHVLAENHIFLVEGKNKEVAGTTYKALKEILQRIRESGYFSRPSVPAPVEESVTSSDESREEPEVCAVEEVEEVEAAAAAEVEEVPAAPLQEVLDEQGTFNFLQESQIDLDTPHMDPAVVAVHPMAPSLPFHTEEKEEPLPQNGQPTDFDPSHPIPTQTFTNQSFAVMQNMIEVPDSNGTTDDPPEEGAKNQTKESNGPPNFRGGYRRGRGRGNNFFRGRGNYYNGRGGYQNNYYRDRNGYYDNYRRNNRGSRGGNRGNFSHPRTAPPQKTEAQQ